MKFEKLNIEETKLAKAEMSNVKGGTSTTTYTQTGYAEMEQELDENGNKIGEPKLMEWTE